MTRKPTDTTDSTRVMQTGPPRPDGGCAYVVVIHGEQVGRGYRIETAALHVGRSPECDVELRDESVSRQHCRIAPDEEGYLLTDLGSTNGTFVNDRPATRHRLNNGDRIRTGRAILKFLSADDVERAFHEEVQRCLTTDTLTGAYNRGYFDEQMRREKSRALRHGRPLSLLMIDIDRFKDVNDRYGHLTGDRVLAKLGGIVAGSIRVEDTFCRWGGEEFALLMPEMESAEAVNVAERLRAAVEKADFGLGTPPPQVTISIGAASLTGEGDDPLKTADERLYAAKRGGRNRVVPRPVA